MITRQTSFEYGGFNGNLRGARFPGELSVSTISRSLINFVSCYLIGSCLQLHWLDIIILSVTSSAQSSMNEIDYSKNSFPRKVHSKKRIPGIQTTVSIKNILFVFIYKTARNVWVLSISIREMKKRS